MEGTGSFEPHRTRAGPAHRQFTRVICPMHALDTSRRTHV